jgi:hypothetical protein
MSGVGFAQRKDLFPVEGMKNRTAALNRFVAHIPRRTRLIFAFLILLSLLLSNGRVINQVDSTPASLLSVAILFDRSVTFDGIIERLGGEVPAQIVKTRRGFVSYYPIMSGLMALPIYAPVIGVMELVASPTPQRLAHFVVGFQKVPAATIAALAVLVFWRLCEAVEFPTRLSMCLALWFAFGSELFSIGAMALWQHGPGTLAVVAAVDAQVRLRNNPTTTQALVLSALCGLAIAIRPTNVLIVGPFGLLGLTQNPRLWLPLFVPMAGIVALLMAYNLYFFGGALGGYTSEEGGFAIGNLAQGLLGLLFSPGRGLLVYFVVTGLAAAALVIRPHTFTDPTAIAAIFSVVVTVLFYSSYQGWCGAQSYGPRYLSEIEPFILLLFGLAWQRMSRPLQRSFLIAAFSLLPLGIFVQGVGVYSVAAIRWSGPSWDMADNPIFRGLHITPAQGYYSSC